MTLSLFFFNDTATTEIYTLSLHDALPIWCFEANANGAAFQSISFVPQREAFAFEVDATPALVGSGMDGGVVLSDADRKSTRLNSSHANISYAVFCLKKKKIPPAIEPNINH